MNPTRFRVFLSVGIVALCAGISLGAWFFPRTSAERPGENSSGDLGSATAASSDLTTAPDHGQTPGLGAKFHAIRQQRATDVIAGVPTLLAKADDAKAAMEFADAMSVRECAQVFQLLIVQPRSPQWSRALETLLLSIAMRDVRSAVALRASVRDPKLQEEFTEWMFSRCPDCYASPEKVARWLNEQGGKFFDPDTVAARMAPNLERWGFHDPVAATRYIIGLPPGADRMSATEREKSLDRFGDDVPPLARTLRNICASWNSDDPQAAMAWVEALPDAYPGKTGALSGVLADAARKSPDQAKAFVEGQFATNRNAAKLAAAVGVELVEKKPTAACEWVLSLPDVAAREEILTKVVGRWESQVARFRRRSVDQTENGESIPPAVGWANAWPTDENQGAVWSAVAASCALDYFGYDVTKWLDTLPPGPNRDRAIAAYDQAVIRAARFKFSDDLQGYALNLLQTEILDPGVAREQVQSHLARWARTKPRDAASWAREHGVAMPTVASGNR